MDMSQYRDLFVSESREHLSSFSDLIVQLEESPDDTASINELFRHAHSLKGMAATMGYEKIVLIAHLMEDKLGLIRSGKSELHPAFADLLLEGSDLLTELVSQIESGNETEIDTSSLAEKLETFDPSAETSKDVLVKETHKTENLPKAETDSPPHQFRHSDSLSSIRIKTETLDHLVNITGELISNRYRLAESIRLAGADQCKEPLHQLTALVRDLRDEIFKARMLPFVVIAERFPRLVRDLARKQGKEIQFQLEGKEIELDRGILEEITEPIVHILRNAVDHGLETPDERVMAGKPFGGKITLSLRRDKDHVEIIISDDGRGMDSEVLKLKGIERGVISEAEANLMTKQDIYQLICAPGFSTAAVITDISGRGVGMDAVHEALHALGGTLTISSEKGLGSSFVLRLPMTVSIIHALIVRGGAFKIAFPLTAVSRTVEIKKNEISKLSEVSGGTTLILDGVEIPLKNMRLLLNLPEAQENGDSLQSILLCEVGGGMIAFTVDSIVGEQEIFVRPLKPPLSSLRGISGATIAADGGVIFIADVTAL